MNHAKSPMKIYLSGLMSGLSLVGSLLFISPTDNTGRTTTFDFNVIINNHRESDEPYQGLKIKEKL